MNSDPILTVESVTKRFSTVLAVDQLSFEVRRGEVFALLGPNGAGKSTTVRMLAGITMPDSGDLRFRLNGDGTTTPKAPPSQLGYLPEERGLYPDKPLLTSLLYLAALRGIDRETATRHAMDWLERFGLAERAKDKVNTLSKGNQQKVQLIAGVLHEPKLAVLDEPFSGFDPVNQDLVLGIIRELRDRGMTIVLSAHHMDLVETLADYILLMHQGRSVLEGTMADIRASAGMGQRLNLTFGGGAPEATKLSGVTGVQEVLSRTGTSARVVLSQDARVGAVLNSLTAEFDIVDVDTDTPTLREIYLSTVGGGAQ